MAQIQKFAILYLSTSEASNEARNRILLSLDKWEQDVINGTLVNAGLDPNSTLDPVKWDGDIETADAATKGEQAGLALFHYSFQWLLRSGRLPVPYNRLSI